VATVAADRKSFRMDMRMTQEQREQIERASELKGMSLTQWALGNLLDAARRDIEEETVTKLSAQEFDRFLELIEQPMPVEAQALMEQEPLWS
jgi:uncharacterized protein (DUF1778 family)